MGLFLYRGSEEGMNCGRCGKPVVFEPEMMMSFLVESLTKEQADELNRAPLGSVVILRDARVVAVTHKEGECEV
jgi:hypothetical protein